MSKDAFHTYLVALASSLTIGVIIPLLILVLMVIMAWVLLARANRDPNFNIAEVFKDADGKVSSERFILLATWVSTTYALVVILFALPQHAEMAFASYLACWGINNAWKYTAKAKYKDGDIPGNLPSTN